MTPAPPRSRTGNRVTALRWVGFLRQLGHHVHLREQTCDCDADLLVALHASKSAPAVAAFRARHLARPVIVIMTGTDLHPEDGGPLTPVSLRTLGAATRIVLLSDGGREVIPAALRGRTVTIVQSARAAPAGPRRQDGRLEVIVAGHLRPVKDPFRAAEAARLLPEESRIVVVQVGAALSAAMRARAEDEMRRNPRYTWLGELPHAATMACIAAADLMCLTSISEGGPSVIAEAIVSGTPVVSSRIASSVGLLGADYPGYFTRGDTPGLAALLLRFEREPAFQDQLRALGLALAPRFDPARERAAIADLIAGVTEARPGSNS